MECILNLQVSSAETMRMFFMEFQLYFIFYFHNKFTYKVL